MSERSFPFDAIEDEHGEPDRLYYSKDFKEWVSMFIGNGIQKDKGDCLQVTCMGSDMFISIELGKAMINGCTYEIENTPKKIRLENADELHDRIDNVVCRYDLTNRQITTLVVKGTPAASPKAPDLVRTDDIYDLLLAQVRVKTGVQNIIQENITDKRMDETVCGIIYNVLGEIETASFFKQYDLQLRQFLDTNRAEFDAWFEEIKGLMGDDVATQLLESVRLLQEDSQKQDREITGLQDGLNKTNQNVTETLNDAKSYTDSEISKVKKSINDNVIAKLNGKADTNLSNISGVNTRVHKIGDVVETYDSSITSSGTYLKLDGGEHKRSSYPILAPWMLASTKSVFANKASLVNDNNAPKAGRVEVLTGVSKNSQNMIFGSYTHNGSSSSNGTMYFYVSKNGGSSFTKKTISLGSVRYMVELSSCVAVSDSGKGLICVLMKGDEYDAGRIFMWYASDIAGSWSSAFNPPSPVTARTDLEDTEMFCVGDYFYLALYYNYDKQLIGLYRTKISTFTTTSVWEQLNVSTVVDKTFIKKVIGDDMCIVGNPFAGKFDVYRSDGSKSTYNGIVDSNALSVACCFKPEGDSYYYFTHFSNSANTVCYKTTNFTNWSKFTIPKMKDNYIANSDQFMGNVGNIFVFGSCNEYKRYESNYDPRIFALNKSNFAMIGSEYNEGYSYACFNSKIVNNILIHGGVNEGSSSDSFVNLRIWKSTLVNPNDYFKTHNKGTNFYIKAK